MLPEREPAKVRRQINGNCVGERDARVRQGVPPRNSRVPLGGSRVTTTSGERRMRIGELAEQLGVNTKTIRYYERIGLLPEPERRPSGYRTYDAGDAERLAFVRSAQRFGLKLDEIREVIALRDRGERPCGFVIGTVRRELAGLDRRIGEMQAMRSQLRELVEHAEATPSVGGGRYCELLEHRGDAEDQMAIETTFKVPMHCGGCENAVRTALQRTEGVIRATADHRRDEVKLRFDPERLSEEQIRERIRVAGFEPV